MKTLVLALVITIGTSLFSSANWFDDIIKSDPLFERVNNGEYIWPNKINVQDTVNDPIFKSVLTEDIKNLSNLLEGGANPNRIGLNGHTPLITAARAGKSKIVYELLKYGAEVNHIDKLEWSALHHTFNEGSASLTVVKILIKAGADPNIRDSRKRTPLHRAAQYGSAEAVKFLLKNGANPSLQDYNNWTPLDRMRLLRNDDSESIKIAEILKKL